DVDARGVRAGHDEIPPLDVRVRHPWTEMRAARVPPKAVQLVPALWEVDLPDESAVARRLRVGVNDAEGVGLGVLPAGEQGDVGASLRGRLGRERRTGRARWIGG